MLYAMCVKRDVYWLLTKNSETKIDTGKIMQMVSEVMNNEIYTKEQPKRNLL